MNSKTVFVDEKSEVLVRNPHEYHQMYVRFYSFSYLKTYIYIYISIYIYIYRVYYWSPYK